ncbi:MAG TPA: radical SAM family heme chaperone HemW [Candidatus Limnocylindria bacterium]|nr:radical SAM family heme chaperone HemW [Candidatus Limnocylindria bacterium]
MSRQPDHLYVHVPFCRLVCAYCDFVTVGGRRGTIPRYVDALVGELALRPAPGELRTIYFGGGTPSLLPADAVARLVRAAMDRWSGRTAVEEVTLEANPSARERPDWAALRAAGITRISLGVQSLRDADLVALARGHTADEARDAYRGARAGGFDNVSVDLIYGIPGQSLDEWRDGLERALALDPMPDHLSCYALQLSLAPDAWAAAPRPGALRWRRRLEARQDDGLAAAQYQLAEELLAAAGYDHYELSSWARPGRESRHNAAYWARRAYIGLGAGAHSYDGASHRSWNRRDLDGYLERVAAGERPLGGEEELDDGARAFEAVALGLRRVAGVPRAALEAELGEGAARQFDRGVAEGLERGLLEVEGDLVRLSAAGRLLANEALLGFLPDARRVPLTSV